uniref:Uncharacterized protein MANES_11G092400 n=1 Tax=Rhizophora mucronata TaxID=61149 RepID=A0A2P2LJF7_RHIMU
MLETNFQAFALHLLRLALATFFFLILIIGLISISLPDYRLRQSGEAINLLESNLIPLRHSHDNRIGDLKGGVHSQR